MAGEVVSIFSGSLLFPPREERSVTSLTHSHFLPAMCAHTHTHTTAAPFFLSLSITSSSVSLTVAVSFFFSYFSTSVALFWFWFYQRMSGQLNKKKIVLIKHYYKKSKLIMFVG